MARLPLSHSGEWLTPSQARRLFEYNDRVLGRFVRRLRRLPWRTVQRKREIAHQSLFETVVHILNVREVWLGYVLQGRTSDAQLERLFADRDRHPKDWAMFRHYERRVRATTDAYLAGLTPAQLRERVHVFWMPGRYVASDGLMQVSFEQAHHLGEVIAGMWQDDLEPPEMTWIGVGRGLPRTGERPGRRPR